MKTGTMAFRLKPTACAALACLSLGFVLPTLATLTAPSALNLRISKNDSVLISPTLYGYMWEVCEQRHDLRTCP